MAEQKVGTEIVSREKGRLYYLGKNGHVQSKGIGKHGGPKRDETSEVVKREPGYLYFISKKGYVARVPQKRGRGARERG